MKKIALPFFLMTTSFCSCENKNALPTPADECTTVSYAQHVQPIISAHCAIAGCHVTGFPPWDFRAYEGVRAHVENGFFQSKVLEQKSMPPLDSLNEGELETLQCWFEQGALNN